MASKEEARPAGEQAPTQPRQAPALPEARPEALAPHGGGEVGAGPQRAEGDPSQTAAGPRAPQPTRPGLEAGEPLPPPRQTPGEEVSQPPPAQLCSLGPPQGAGGHRHLCAPPKNERRHEGGPLGHAATNGGRHTGDSGRESAKQAETMPSLGQRGEPSCRSSSNSAYHGSPRESTSPGDLRAQSPLVSQIQAQATRSRGSQRQGSQSDSDSDRSQDFRPPAKRARYAAQSNIRARSPSPHSSEDEGPP
ncbi:basic salivary proline-rich protein 3-like, partial [Sceloporus undulatus]|uniref:basic salivary proline-rich protein 3-like n=1 Tax=Sceloporus undulatus TaxID=8520 RepID=UPI001C4BBE69